jgi:hypothetical protein
LGEGLSDRRSIGEEEKSKVGMAEPRLLSGEIPEEDWGTWCLINTLHHSNIFPQELLWDRESFSRWGSSHRIVRRPLRDSDLLWGSFELEISFWSGRYGFQESGFWKHRKGFW